MTETNEIKDERIKTEVNIDDYSVVSVLFHDKQKEILRLLIEEELTIIEISKRLDGLNPGTVKRHLMKLEEAHLIFISREEKNEFGINMKYYRSVAKKFNVHLYFP